MRSTACVACSASNLPFLQCSDANHHKSIQRQWDAMSEETTNSDYSQEPFVVKILCSHFKEEKDEKRKNAFRCHCYDCVKIKQV